MDSFYNKNGLIFWNSRSIQIRDMFTRYFAERVREILLSSNPAWQFHHIEAPLLMPRELINKNYTDEDVYFVDSDLVLRPETTPGSYQWARVMLDDSNSKVRPPLCVWQAGKSFRKEQDQPTKHVKLKEFYQQEFQCIFTSDTANDYHSVFINPVEKMIKDMLALPSRVIKSDRLPAYSKSTIDIEIYNGDKWMEVCSMSLRTDFPGVVKFPTKKGVIERDLLVAEIAIGLDRCVYNYLKRADNDSIEISSCS